MSQEVLISFAESSSSQKSKSAASLADKLKDLKELNHVEVLREREDSQDAGTIISIILGAPAIVVAVKAIAAWAVRQNQSDVTISTKKGDVLLKNLRSENVPDAIKALKDIID